MAPISNEWIQARDLLLSLAQALAPIAGESSPLFKAGGSLSLHQRLFIPHLGQPGTASSFRHPVRLLTALHSAREGIEELLDKLPPAEKAEPASNSSDEQSTEKPIFEKTKPAEAQRENEVSAKSGAPAGEKIWVGKKPNQPPTVANQAQKLVDQVRVAIRSLSSSYVFSNPHEAPLKDVFERLKPLVEEMIAAVGRGDMPSSDSGSASPFRLPLPISPREHLLKKQVPFPKAETPVSPKESAESHTWVPQRELKREPSGQPFAIKSESSEKSLVESLRRDLGRQDREFQIAEREEVRKTPLRKSETEYQQPLGRAPVLPPQKPPPPMGSFTPVISSEPEPRLPVAERTILPAAPFFPGQVPLSSAEKKKKKKRGLWEPKEREDLDR